jgi:hypothetical protein
MKMEAVGPSETLVTIYQATRRYIPEDSYLHDHLKSHTEIRTLDVPVAGVKTLDLTIGTNWFRCQIRFIRCTRVTNQGE